jgi:hypothetical protein
MSSIGVLLRVSDKLHSGPQHKVVQVINFGNLFRID